MSTSLKTYRIYTFDGVSRVVSADFIDAANDEGATAKIQADGFGTKCELWDGRRLVAQLDQDSRLA